MPSPGGQPTRSEERPQVLFVHGEHVQLPDLRAIVEGLCAALVEVRSGDEAVHGLREGDFAVALIDAELAGAGGFDAAELIRHQSACRHLPSIFLAPPDCTTLSASRAYTLGAVDYLVLPIPSDILRAKVSGLIDLYLDRRRAEREAEQLRQLINGTNDYAIFMLDPEGRVTTWNAGAQRIKGYTAEEIIGQHFTKFYPQEAIDRGWPEHELKVARAVGRFEDEGWRLRKDGTPFWANVVITTLRDSVGNVIGFSKITRDLTERRKAEEMLRHAHAELEVRVRQRTAELARANEALQEADRRKDEFLAMLAHELRNPLAPIRNALQVLKMPGVGPEALRKAQDMVERQIVHLVRMVDDLLDVSRILRGKITLRKERLALSEVFSRAVETAHPVIETQGQELTVTLPDPPLYLEGDLVRLAQVVSNLLVNAAKYTDRAGRIWLTGERDGNEAVIRVRDTGVGIDATLLPLIFEPFVQAERSLARSQGGLGVGLTLVRRLVELHGGTVSASSPGPGQGSEFVVRLPALLDGDDELAARPERLSRGSTAPRRVLVVDDNVDAAESAAMLLRFLGHEVAMAHDGFAALEMVRDFRPEIVLLDLGLPGMSGYDVARTLRALPENKGLVIAAVTGYGQEEDRRRSKEAGIDYHLTKPLAPQTLTAFVDSPRAGPPTGELAGA
jgi:PAS domain S-box-containing protein